MFSTQERCWCGCHCGVVECRWCHCRRLVAVVFLSHLLNQLHCLHHVEGSCIFALCLCLGVVVIIALHSLFCTMLRVLGAVAIVALRLCLGTIVIIALQSFFFTYFLRRHVIGIALLSCCRRCIALV